MESFAKLKRRGTDLINSLPHNLPSMPQLPHLPHHKSGVPTMKGTWQHVSIPPLPRSSHTLDIVAGNAYVFGGAADNDIHVVALPSSGAPADYYAIKAKPSPNQPQEQSSSAKTKQPISEEDETEAQLQDPLSDVPLASPPPVDPASEPSSATTDKGKSKDISTPTDQVPRPRAGHASAVIGSRIFVFGGRDPSASASKPLDEGGRVWVFETKTHTWTYLDPYTSSSRSSQPAPRSDLAATATDKPRDFSVKPLRRRRTSSWKEWAEGDSADVGIPQRPVAGSVAERATDEEDAGFGTFVIHGGLLGDGSRAADVWAFDVRSRTWKELPSAPEPARAGAALAFAKGRLYRFGGFDGENELGGQLDILELVLDEFDDRVSRGEVGVSARGGWESILAPVTSAPPPSAEDTARLVPVAEWPANRSAASLELVLGGGGREYLVLMLGERAAGGSSFYDDIWTFQVPPEGMSAASFRDAVLQAVGRPTGEGKWMRVVAGPYDDDEAADARGPGARGWVASAPLGDLEENAILVFGGVGERNEKLGDGWIFRLD